MPVCRGRQSLCGWPEPGDCPARFHEVGLALATWSHDGRHLYASTLVGGTGVTHRIPVGGGPMEHVAGRRFGARECGRQVSSLLERPRSPRFPPGPEWRCGQEPRRPLSPTCLARITSFSGYAPVAGGIYYVSGDAHGKAGAFRSLTTVLANRSVCGCRDSIKGSTSRPTGASFSRRRCGNRGRSAVARAAVAEALMNADSRDLKPYLALAAVCLFWGTTYLGIRMSLESRSRRCC